MKKLIPRKADTISKICKLKRDNVGTKHYWFSIDEHEVTLCKQSMGCEAMCILTMPKRTFNLFVDYYEGRIK